CLSHVCDGSLPLENLVCNVDGDQAGPVAGDGGPVGRLHGKAFVVVSRLKIRGRDEANLCARVDKEVPLDPLVSKVVYISCSYGTVWLIYSKFKATYDGNHDTFRVEFLLVPAAILAFIVNHDFTPLEIMWTFSIYLEAVAILPQLFLVSRTGEAEAITSHYLFALGLYRGLYLLNWLWRYQTEAFSDLIVIVAGIVQTVLYCDFFYLYVTKVLQGKKLSLPA
ncbi:ER lumen protein-retaining receptor 1-like, partial [Narcine bancroftii]|uniref:ER lumen protein-retaining receptor 1-like n=1 Tax=Narcine bancroftii TaxID=1343680 RepID=UPI00383219E9